MQNLSPQKLFEFASTFVPCLQRELAGSSILSGSAKASVQRTLDTYLAAPAFETQLGIACTLWSESSRLLGSGIHEVRLSDYLAAKRQNLSTILTEVDIKKLFTFAEEIQSIPGCSHVQIITTPEQLLVDEYHEAFFHSHNFSTAIFCDNMAVNHLNIFPLPLYAALIALRQPDRSLLLYLDCTASQSPNLPNLPNYSPSEIIRLLKTNKRVVEFILTKNRIDGNIVHNLTPFLLHDIAHAADFAETNKNLWDTLVKFFELLCDADPQLPTEVYTEIERRISDSDLLSGSLELQESFNTAIDATNLSSQDKHNVFSKLRIFCRDQLHMEALEIELLIPPFYRVRLS